MAAVFSVNQNRQLYVATEVGTVSEESNVGTIEVGSITPGVEKQLFFKYKGADTTLRSDLIDACKIAYAKAIKAEDMQDKLKQVKVTLDADVNGGEPVSGQDYVLRIAFRQFYGMSDEDQYFKFGCVHATSNMTAEQFYTKMVESLEKNFSKEIDKVLSFEATSDGILIKELEQPWHLGTMQQERVYFEVYPGTVCVDGDEQQWGVTQATGETKNSKGEDVEALAEAGVIENGKKIADLEYFCMGERGDQYRMKGWPRVIPTEYLVDPSATYNVLEIHYFFTDSGVNSYKSEKDITIVAEDASVINSLVEKINEISGLSIETLA